MSDNNRDYDPRPVELPSDDSEFFDRPFFAYGIFQKGQLAYSKIADCIETVERDGIHREMHIRDGVPVIKNEISDKITKGDKIHFIDGRKEDAYEIISNTQLGNVYEWDTVYIDDETFNILVTQKLSGTFLNVDNNQNYQDYFDGSKDPFFSKVVKFINNELENRDPDECDIFKFQMYYMLLWSAIERYCVLKYDVSKNQGEYLKALSDDELFKEALDVVNPKNRDKIYSAKNASHLYFNKNMPNFIVNYYYTIRSNVAHRGKEPENNFEALEDSLNDLLKIFDYIIKKTFGDENENLVQ